MATINHTHPLSTLKAAPQNIGELSFATITEFEDEDLISKIWNRDLCDLATCNALLHELAFRYELEVLGSY